MCQKTARRRELRRATVCWKAAQGERCSRRPCVGIRASAAKKVTVWKETAKANAGNSGVCGKTAKANGAQQRSWKQGCWLPTMLREARSGEARLEGQVFTTVAEADEGRERGRKVILLWSRPSGDPFVPGWQSCSKLAKVGASVRIGRCPGLCKELRCSPGLTGFQPCWRAAVLPQIH